MAAHIQIGDLSPRIQYTADGLQTVFPYPFPVFNELDIQAYVDGALKILTTDYTVIGAGVSAGGAVTFLIPPISGAVVTLRREMAIARTSDFQESGEFRAKVINDELDILTALLQQVNEQSARALHIGPTDGSSLTELPGVSVRASRFLGFDANGDPIASAGSVDTLAVSGFIATLLGAVDAATARAALGAVIGTDVLAPTGDGSGLTGIAAGATAAEKANIALNAFRIAVNGGLSVQNMIDGVVDEFTDQTGVDLVASLNETYDATGDYYHNPTPYTADQVPVMTGTSTPSGTVLFDSEQVGSEAWKAFDASTVTTWGSNSGIGSVNTAYIGYDFGVGITKTLRAFTHLDTGGVFHPASVLLQYSDDGITWTTQGIYTLTNTTVRETVYTTATTAHRYWRLKGNVTTTISGANNWFANDVEFLELGAAPNMTLQSNTHTALVQPSSVFVVLWHETVDVVTLNTDLKVWVSRDGGMTWTQAVLALAASLSGNEQILSGSANISAQPAGMSLKWKIETLTNKEQRLRGVSEQWS